jgi:hypothetical protein
MARNLSFQVLRGIYANMPALNDGEFYFATDRGYLYVGFAGGNLQVAIMGMQISDPSTGTNIAAVQPKGTQGTFMLCVQDAKDTGRTQVSFTLDAVAGVTVEALATMAITKGLVAQTPATSYTVTAGKTLRIQSISVTILATAATALTSAKVRLRGALSAFSATSPILIALATTPASASALAGADGSIEQDFPDGLEIPGGAIVGLSQVVSSTSSAVTVTVVGYEY